MYIRRSVSGPRLILEQISDRQGVQTFRALDLRRRRRIVLKVQQPTDDVEAIERFRREAIALSLIDHPNVISLYGYTENEPRTLALEDIRAETLADCVQWKGSLSAEAVCRMVEDIAAALDCSHGRGVLHRDVRPDNILLPRRGPARLTDYGAAKIAGEPQITLMGRKLREHAFVSPEQLRFDPAQDARADVYSLAAVAYFALTGNAPANEWTPARNFRPELAPEIDAVLANGLAVNAAHRYHTAGQMAAAFRIALESCRSKYRSRRMNLPQLSLVTAIVTIAVSALVFWHFRPQPVVVPAPKHSATNVNTPAAQIRLASVPRHYGASSDVRHGR